MGLFPGDGAELASARVPFVGAGTSDGILPAAHDRGDRPAVWNSRNREVEFFAQATIDPVTRTVVWPNGADLAPDALHDGAFDSISAA